MKTNKAEVVHLHRRDPQAALERLNRITGLSFSRWPESLVQPWATGAQAAPQDTDEMRVGRDVLSG